MLSGQGQKGLHGLCSVMLLTARRQACGNVISRGLGYPGAVDRFQDSHIGRHRHRGRGRGRLLQNEPRRTGPVVVAHLARFSCDTYHWYTHREPSQATTGFNFTIAPCEAHAISISRCPYHHRLSFASLIKG